MLIEKIKADHICAKKTKNAFANTILTTLLGEVQRTQKSPRDVPTDEQVEAVIRSNIKKLQETMNELHKRGHTAASQEQERNFLVKYLPRQLSGADLLVLVELKIAETGVTDIKGLGKVMGALNATHKGLFDNKNATIIIRKKLG